jgi:chromosome partitioning protein
VIEPPRADPEAISRLSEKAGLVLQRAREAALEPNHRKVLRRWTLTEVAEILGTTAKVVSSRIEKMSLPSGEREGKRRLFTLQEIHAIQESLGTLPRQRFEIREPVVIAVANFKGGVGKTSTAIHLAQYFALKGYRTLAVDLDAQASFTGLFGLLPDSEVPEEKTANPFFYGPEIGADTWTGTLATAIQETYWPGLDLLAANLSLYGAEFALAKRQNAEEGFAFWSPLKQGLATVADRYDVVVIDTPPSLSFVTTNAIYAADGLVIPVPPAMLDFASATHFFSLLKEVLDAIQANEGKPKIYDFLSLLIAKYQHGNQVHQQLSAWVRGIFGDYTLPSPMLLTTVVQNIGPQLLSIYEVQDYKGDRRTFRRALDSTNAVSGEVEQQVLTVLKRREPAVRPKASAA